MLAAAFSASSKSDFQQASLIRVDERARRDRLAALVADILWIGKGPVFLVFCGDARRLERLGELRGHQADNSKLGFSTPRQRSSAAVRPAYPQPPRCSR